jgi:hypothetical protein
MSRTCLACSSSEREDIDKALVAREQLRNIAKRVSISPAGLLRHKAHLSQAILRESERREERIGDSLVEEMRRVQRKAWEMLARTESEGDHTGAIVALREVREWLECSARCWLKLVRVPGLPWHKCLRLGEEWAN